MIFKFDKNEPIAPHEIIMESVNFVPNNSKFALDIGVGNGHNSIFLSLNGYKVHAIDKSKITVNELGELIASEALPINTEIKDVISYTPDFRAYDLVLFMHVLHYLPKVRATYLLKDAIQIAKVNTIHIVGVILNEGDFCKIQKDENYFYPSEETILKMYDTTIWTIRKKYVVTEYMKQMDSFGRQMKNKVLLAILQKNKEDDK